MSKDDGGLKLSDVLRLEGENVIIQPVGALEVGTNDRGEVVVNGGKAAVDATGDWHIVFSPRQARHFAQCLIKHADAGDEILTGATQESGR